MKVKYLAVALASMVIGNTAMADEDLVTYSTEGYCVLKQDGMDDRYLAAYAKKLGFTPDRKTCKSFNEFVTSVRPKKWDYPLGKPYPGSLIRLTPAQIEKIKAARDK